MLNLLGRVMANLMTRILFWQRSQHFTKEAHTLLYFTEISIVKLL